MIKQAAFRIKGMNRDLSASAFNPEYAYENKNVRILSTDENTQFSITNEKGNKYTEIMNIGDIEGTPLGQATLNNELVLFVSGGNETKEFNIEASSREVTNILAPSTDIPSIFSKYSDKIYKLWFDKGLLTGKMLYEGNLNFDLRHPIEALSFYENEDIKKVYWVDGLNQPRVINISREDVVDYNDDSFNFVKKLSFTERLNVAKNTEANGMFSSGVIQYAFTYFNKFGQESNIVKVSPLYYISYSNRGADAETKLSNSFTITISNPDKSFDYVRIYSIQRTSENTVPEVKKVIDLSTKTDVITYTDNGTTGEIIDPTSLLYIGGKEIIAGTISQKDNTLFLGDLRLKDLNFTEKEEEDIRKKCTLSLGYKSIPNKEPIGFYPYYNQLDNNSREIKGFKGGETYRIAIQFQHENGSYSSPVWIKDIKNTNYPEVSDLTVKIPQILCSTEGLKDLLPKGYKKARLLMAVPNSTDKSVVCQGALCPTLFNMGDRYSNAPFAISSWFMRPDSLDFGEDTFLQYRHNQPLPGNDKRNGEIQSTINPGSIYIKRDMPSTEKMVAEFFFYDQGDIPNFDRPYLYSLHRGDTQVYWKGWKTYSSAKAALIPEIGEDKIPTREAWEAANSKEKVIKVDVVITNNDSRKKEAKVGEEGDNFYVDQSILTFHSPDIENNTVDLEGSKLELRIVGIAQITANMSDHNITTSTPPKDAGSKGEVNYISDESNLIRAKGLISAPLWNDIAYTTGGTIQTLFITYPWHRSGPLNADNETDNAKKSALLKHKIFSNVRYSYYTKYFTSSKIWDASEKAEGITPISIFNSDVISNIRIPKPKNSYLIDMNYYGNVDKVVFYNLKKDKDGYPIQCVGSLVEDSIFSSLRQDYLEVGKGKDPISIKYKSTPHAVFAFNYTKDGKQVILPALNDSDSFTSYDKGESMNGFTPWGEDSKYKNTVFIDYIMADLPPTNEPEKNVWYNPNDGIMRYLDGSDWIITGYEFTADTLYVYQENNYRAEPKKDDWTRCNLILIESGVKQSIIGENSAYPFVYIAELYRKINENTIYGGTSRSAIINNNWIPISDTFAIDTEINKTEGDTYFQRWDCLKTYAFTKEDTNSIVDITSFMLETRTNVAGRYDRNRGQKNSTVMSPTNFNLINPVYSQSNNFFNYRVLDDKFDLNSFPTSITWTKTKQEAADIDAWTNITMASILDLDGDKGPVRALRRLNNNIIAFQDKGISQVLYNENVQIQSTEGVPIELANSGKVQGKRYINDKVGCTNKWSICESPNGLYFVDDITKGIYLFNGQVNNISDSAGFHSWINKMSKDISIWNPIDKNNVVAYYDRINGDVFFIYKDECLAFSEPLRMFSSFYSYEGTPYYSTLEDRGLWFKPFGDITKIWLHNEGDYNMFFGEYKPFYIEVIANPNPTTDKIFNNVEFRADSWEGNKLSSDTFDTLHVHNEYQEGTADLTNIPNRPSSLKKKFRIWRANIPRDNSNHRDRMRNPWLYVKLAKMKENTSKTVLHDIVIDYFE